MLTNKSLFLVHVTVWRSSGDFLCRFTVPGVTQRFRLLAFYNSSTLQSSTSSYTGKRECEGHSPAQLPQTGSSTSLPSTFPSAVTQSHGPKSLQGRLENEVLCTQEGHVDGWASCQPLPSNCITSGPLHPRSSLANSIHPFTQEFLMSLPSKYGESNSWSPPLLPSPWSQPPSSISLTTAIGSLLALLLPPLPCTICSQNQPE